MNPDEQLLERVHREAGRRIRRRRAALSAAVVIAIIGISAAAAAVTSRDAGDLVVTTAPDVTTSTAAPSTTSTSTSTSTSSSTSTTSTAVATTTTVPPIAPVTATNQTGGVKATVTVTQDRARPGVVELTVRVEDGYGGDPVGYALWGGGANTMWGGWGTADGTGDDIGTSYSECDEGMDSDPTTNLGPDPTAAAVDRTIVLTHDYGSVRGDTLVRVAVYTSLCTTDEESTPIELIVPISS